MDSAERRRNTNIGRPASDWSRTLVLGGSGGSWSLSAGRKGLGLMVEDCDFCDRRGRQRENRRGALFARKSIYFFITSLSCFAWMIDGLELSNDSVWRCCGLPLGGVCMYYDMRFLVFGGWGSSEDGFNGGWDAFVCCFAITALACMIHRWRRYKGQHDMLQNTFVVAT